MAPVRRRSFLAVLIAAPVIAAIAPKVQASVPFASGDFVYRPSAAHRWGRAQSFDAVLLGGEFGVYDGSRVVTSGRVMMKIHDKRMLVTQMGVWKVLPRG
jgi:hypothetical protein